MKNNINLCYLIQFFLARDMLQTKVAEKIKTYLTCNNVFSFPKILQFRR